MTGFFNGIATAMITPFDENGVNYESFSEMIERQIDCGIDALVVIGTTGEPATMTEEEKSELMRFTVEKVEKRVKVIFGTGANNTAKAVAFSKEAERAGADGLLVVTPYYNKCTQNGIYEYYKTIHDAVNIPVIAYNVPSRTGVNILPATAERLATLTRMAGIKEACGKMDQICETMRRIRGKIDLYSGDDAINLPILAIGGTGVISVVSNLLPKEVKEMYNLVKEGKLAEANALQDRLIPVINACFTEVNPIPVKAGANMLGMNAGVPRAPLTELEAAHKEILRRELETFGTEVVNG